MSLPWNTAEVVRIKMQRTKFSRTGQMGLSTNTVSSNKTWIEMKLNQKDWNIKSSKLIGWCHYTVSLKKKQ